MHKGKNNNINGKELLTMLLNAQECLELLNILC